MAVAAAARGAIPGPHVVRCIRSDRRPAMGASLSLIAFIVVVALAVMTMTLRIANQYQRAVIFRLGRYSRTGGPGLYFLWPFIEWQTTLDLRTRTTIVE